MVFRFLPATLSTQHWCNTTGITMEDGERLTLSLQGGVGLFFGTVVVTTCALAWKEQRISLDQQQLLFNGVDNHGSSTLMSSLQRWILLSRIFVIGLVVVIAFVCEHFFMHSSKPFWDIDQFASWIILLVSFAIFYERGKPSDIVSEQHTTNFLQNEYRILQELKGLGLSIFCFYQYFQHNNDDTRHNDLIPQLFCNVYCWVTSFQSASYFHATHDVTTKRLFASLIKPVSLCVLFGLAIGQREWMLYQICFLEIWATFWTWMVFGVASHWNKSKWGLRIKLSLAGLTGYCIWDIPNPRMFMWLFGLFFLGENPRVYGMMWEWYQLTVQHHWSILFGIAYAINFPVIHLWRQKLEYQQQSTRHETSKSAVLHAFMLQIMPCVFALALTIALASWNKPIPSGKISSNRVNIHATYWSTVVILFVVYMRTCTKWLRKRALSIFVLLGECALEASILYPHIFLTSNGRQVLSLTSPGWSKVNLIVLVIGLISISTVVFRIYKSMARTLEAETDMATMTVLAILTTFVISLQVSLLCLWFTNTMDWWYVLALSIPFGWTTFALLVNTNADRGVIRGNLNSQMFWIGSLGLVCTMFLATATFLVQSSPNDQSIAWGAECHQAVQTGAWFPINTCNEATQSFAFRKHHIVSIGSCSNSEEILAWGWNHTAVAEGKCTVGSRDRAKLLHKILRHRNLKFVGDSMIRHLYHATCRQVGHRDAGAYNTTLGKWSDYSRHYQPNTTLDFRWAPFIRETIPIVQQMTKDVGGRPDALIIGGGAWDLLHNTRTKENLTAFDSNIGTLAHSLNLLKKSGQLVIWVEPTEINTWALNTADKHTYMREDQMVKLREKYRQKGVAEAATFVLSGLAFSRDRVDECYDGVHYPFSVYNGGAQILLNAVEGLMPPMRSRVFVYEFGSMAHPRLGLVLLLLLVLCLVSMDNFFGLSYLVAFFLRPFQTPLSLHSQAMASYHEIANTLSNSIESKSKSSDQVGEEDRDLTELDVFLPTAIDGEGLSED